MAKQLLRLSRRNASRLGFLTSRWWTRRRILRALAVAGLAVYVAVAYLALPRELPAIAQRTLALGFAALAAAAFAVATRRTELPDEAAQRLRMGQHSDFGKELRSARAARRTTIRLPGVGEISLRLLAGIGVFIVAAAWWYTPWAPVRVGKPKVVDLTVPLGEEIATAILVLPDPHSAVLAPPVMPATVRKAAKLIRDDDPPPQLALRAIAEERYGDARAILASLQGQESDKARLLLVRAQLEMYACRFDSASQAYGELLGQEPDDPMLLCQAAVAAMQAGEPMKAETLTNQAIKICDKLAAKDASAAVARHVQVLVYLYRGKDFNEALKLAQQSRKTWEEATGADHAGVAASVNNQAVLFALKADAAAAREYFQWAQDVWSRIAPANDSRLATVRCNFAMFHYGLGNYAKAEALLREAAAIHREGLPEGHGLVGLGLNCQAVLDRALGNFDAAQTAAEQSLVICEKGMGPDNAAVCPVLDNLSAIYADRACYARAYATCSRAVSAAKRLWGTEHPFVAEDLCHLAALQTLQARYPEAEAICKEAQRIVERSFGQSHPSFAIEQATRGRLEIARGEPRDARPYLNQARKSWEDIFRQSWGEVYRKQHPEWSGRPEHPEYARLLGDLASLDNSPTTSDRGIDGYQRAIEMMERFVGAGHPDVARLLCGQAVLYAGRDELDKAKECLDRAWTIQEKSLVAYHPDLATTLEIHASVFEKMTPPKTEEAKEMLARAKAIRAKQREEDHVRK